MLLWGRGILSGSCSLELFFYLIFCANFLGSFLYFFGIRSRHFGVCVVKYTHQMIYYKNFLGGT